jgi:LPS-assembly protein
MQLPSPALPRADRAFRRARAGFALALGLSATAAGAAPPIVLQAQEIRGRPDLEAVAEGMVEFRRGEVTVFADRLSYEQASDLASARGNVRIERPGSVFKGPELQLRVERFEGFFLEPEFMLLDRGTRGRAERVDFLDRSRSVATRAEYTSCPADDPDGPDWLISADRVSLDIDANEGVAEGAVLRFLGVPILAGPRMSFPITEARKSGWLPPTVSIDNRAGLDLTVPYYWNIAPQRDATIAPRVSLRRGLGVEGEFRYLEPSFAGDVSAVWLPNDRVADRSRYALALRHEGQAPAGLRYGAQGARVSDDDWWKDFSNVGDAVTPRLLPLNLQLDRPFDLPGGQGLAYARVLRWQVLQTDEAVITPPYSRSPQVGVSGEMTGVAGLTFGLLAEYNRFRVVEQPEASIFFNLPNGTRAHAVASVARPWREPGWWLVPRASVNTASYETDLPMMDGRTQATRTVPTFSLDGGMTFERRTSFLGRDVQQTLEPRFLYVRTPFVDQSNLPNFDSAPRDFNFNSVYAESNFTGNDRISDANQLTAGLTTRLYDPGSGMELLRLGIVQRYLFSEQLITADGAPNTQRFSDVLLLGSSNLVRKWWLDGAVQYNAESSRAVRSVLTARYAPGPFRTVSTGYRYTRGLSEQVEVGWQWPLYLQREDAAARAPGAAEGGARRAVSSRGMSSAGRCGGDWYSVGRVSYSVEDSRVTDALLGLEYDSGCWIGRLVAERLSTGRSEATTRLMVQLELVGLSRLGPNPLRTLKDNIPGYQMLRDERGRPNSSAP